MHTNSWIGTSRSLPDAPLQWRSDPSDEISLRRSAKPEQLGERDDRRPAATALRGRLPEKVNEVERAGGARPPDEVRGDERPVKRQHPASDVVSR
jgi:hypothetical protein